VIVDGIRGYKPKIKGGTCAINLGIAKVPQLPKRIGKKEKVDQIVVGAM